MPVLLFSLLGLKVSRVMLHNTKKATRGAVFLCLQALLDRVKRKMLAFNIKIV